MCVFMCNLLRHCCVLINYIRIRFQIHLCVVDKDTPLKGTAAMVDSFYWLLDSLIELTGRLV